MRPQSVKKLRIINKENVMIYYVWKYLKRTAMIIAKVYTFRKEDCFPAQLKVWLRSHVFLYFV